MDVMKYFIAVQSSSITPPFAAVESHLIQKMIIAGTQMCNGLMDQAFVLLLQVSSFNIGAYHSH